MRIDKPKNSNYAAVVVSIKNIIPFENCDNVVGTTLLGFQAVISKDVKIGDIGIVFPAETQLSLDYAYHNNLHRHEDLNKNKEARGYLEDNRRIKAVKFRGNRSSALFMPLSSLLFTDFPIEDLKEGDEFDTLNNREICRKYELPQARSSKQQAKQKKSFTRVDTKFMPEHIDSENYFKNKEMISQEEDVTITQKLHGTSVRIGNTIVLRKLSLFEKALKLLGVKIKETEFDNVYGSRHVVKDVNNKDQIHYYQSDIWTKKGEELKGIVPENFLIFGEIVGWVDDKPIQKDYTYKIEQGKSELYIYRVAIINNSGLVTDLTWDQMVLFCNERGLKTVPLIWRGKHKNLKIERYLDTRFYPKYKNCLPLDKGLVDEGICIRKEGLSPTVLKAKSPIFLEHESKMLDSGEADMESTEVS